MNCQRCRSEVGVVWIGTLLLCGDCYFAWAKSLVASKRQDSYLDCVQKMKRVKRSAA